MAQIGGTSSSEVLTGTTGSDVIDGNGGGDVMIGRAGDDWFVVRSAADLVLEEAGNGHDRVFAYVNWSLNAGSQVETLSTFNDATTDAINLTGNELAQTIYGNAGNNILDGFGGGDALVGLGGDDWFVVRHATDRVFETAGGGSDRVFAYVDWVLSAGAHVEILSTYNHTASDAIDLTGNALGQVIQGNAGANILDGGGGGDALAGFGGNDWYVIRDSSDRVFEDAAGGNADRVFAYVDWRLNDGAHVETLSTYNEAAADAIDLTGNSLTQTIQGNAGNNILDGFGGGDFLFGFGGDDWYVIRNSGDAVFEVAGAGSDRVFAYLDWTLTSGAHVETLSTYNEAATDAIDLTGNALVQTIQGNAGNNILDGFGGGDALAGFGGDDWYVVRSGADQVFESAGAGNDRVFVYTSWTLSAGAQVETLSTYNATGTELFALTGNEFAQTIYGNAGGNQLDGKGGSDVLFGDGGADVYAFTTALGPGNVDRIFGFVSGSDRILLGGASGEPFAALASGALSAGAFVIGPAAAEADDVIIYNSTTGALLYDADGSGAGAAVQFATLDARPNLTAADFVVGGPVNSAPTISSGTAATIVENSAASTIVYQTQAADADGDRINYSIGGTDASLFTIDANGAVRLNSPADFESRASYNITVTAYDSSGSGASRQVVVNVLDAADSPGSGPTPVIQETTAANNGIGSAQVISRGTLQPSTNFELFNDDLPSATIRGNISTGSPNADIDFFSITLNAGERLILDIDHTSGNLDALVRIYDAGGAQLGFVDDAALDPGSDQDRTGSTLDSFLSFRAPTTGTYYFSVESWGQGSDNGPGSGTTTGAYDLNVSIGPADSQQQLIDEDVQALIDSNGWSDPNPSRAGVNLTYSFPNSPSDYPAGTSEVQSNFEQFNGVQQAATGIMLQQIASFSNLTFDRLFDGQDQSATLRYAMSDEPDVAYAYLPGGGLGGTAWFRNSPIAGRGSPAFDNPVAGSYSWMSILHESGHALGLKHGHEFPAVSFQRDSVEYTMMTYRSYIGKTPGTGYSNETYGFPSTPMMLDIAALQKMYGANFNFNSGDSVYTWSSSSGQSFVNGAGGLVPGSNRVFMTIWDGGGTDTYNMSNYGTNVSIDLRPGEFSLTSQVQLANLGDGHMARGNVGNAYLFSGDTRSLIENAIGGPGNDTFIANQAANDLTGGGGGDTFRWFTALDAGLGAQADEILDFARSSDRIDLSEIDAITGAAANDSFNFIGTSAFSNVAGQLRYQIEGGNVRIQGDIDGNGVADLEIVVDNVTGLDSTNFFF